MQAIPEGFRPLDRVSPFTGLVGPLYERRRGDDVSLDLRVEKKHAKRRGICLGGLLATLADNTLDSRPGFANCYPVAGEQRIVRASAIFALSARTG